MAFLSPLFLLGALAAAVPIVLHLLRREPETVVKFAAVSMLEHAPVEHAERRRLRQWLLLALRVSALLLLALAFARPFWASGAAGGAGAVTVVALDTSASLSGPGRFARAQELARQAVDQAPAGHQVALVTFADGARLAQAPSSDRALARAAIDAAREGFGGTRYRAALAAAADAIGSRAGRIVVVTDLQASGWDRGERVELSDAVQPVEIADVGPLPTNLAVTAMRSSGDRIVATVRAHGGGARDVHVRLTVDGAPAGEATARVAGRDAADAVEVALPKPAGAGVAVAVDDAGGLSADDTRYFVTTTAARPRVLVVSNAGDPERDAFYLQQALLAAGADGASFDVAGASGAQVSAWDRDVLGRHAAVVLLSTRGLDQRGRELLAGYVQRGGGVLVAVGPDVDGAVAAGAVGVGFEMTVLPAVPAPESRLLAPADLRHPVLRVFAADGPTLALARFRQLAVVRGEGCHVLARFSSGEPGLQECQNGTGRVIVLGSDLDGRWNDFPLHASFVPFVHEAVGYLSGGGDGGQGYVVGSVPTGWPDEPGLRTITGADGRPALVAVNIDGRESDPGRLGVEEFRASILPVPSRPEGPGQPVEARQQEARQNLWRYAILLMAAALVAESLVAARTA